jgi:hypothetical protein
MLVWYNALGRNEVIAVGPYIYIYVFTYTYTHTLFIPEAGSPFIPKAERDCCAQSPVATTLPATTKLTVAIVAEQLMRGRV